MGILLRLSRLIDQLNEHVGKWIAWLVLLNVLISAGNATMRYSFNMSSNAWLEIQWYLFSAVFLLCAGYTLLRNEHIRIDILASRLPPRGQVWLDLIGGVLFLLPMALVIMWLSWPAVADSYMRQEMSSNAGGLIRWPVKILIPIGFALLVLQALSEIVKRIAMLRGELPMPVLMQGHGAADEMLAEHKLDEPTPEKRG